MKKKGFTLIELLAVIVILAIIALIATPIVMNIIENSRKGAAERTAENYLSAVETAIAVARLEEKDVPSGTYTVDADGNLVNGDTTLEVDVNGTKPGVGSTVEIEGYEIKKTGISSVMNLKIGDYTASYNEEGKIEAVKNEEKENKSITVYRWSEEIIRINDPIDPNDEQFTTDPTTLNKDFYLKHVVENNIVKESYACAKFNNKETPTCIRSGENGNSYYNENKLILLGLQDDGINCPYQETWALSCGDGSVYLTTSKDEMAFAFDGGDYFCYAYDSGDSYCTKF